MVALAPVLVEAPVGLDMLKELTYPQALSRAHDRQRRRFLSELGATALVGQLEPRPLLLVYGSDDWLVAQDTFPGGTAVETIRIPGARHQDLPVHARTFVVVSQWLKERL